MSFSSFLHAKFYRLVHQKSTWIILLIALFDAVLWSYIYGVMLGNSALVVELKKQMETQLSGYVSIYGQSYVDEMISMLYAYTAHSGSAYVILPFSNTLIIYFIAFVGFFVTPERRRGTMKNFYPAVSVFKNFCCDLIILLVFAVVLTVLQLGVYVCALPTYFDNLAFGSVTEFAAFVLMEVLLIWLIGGCVLVTLDFFASKRNAIVYSIFYVLFLNSVPYEILNLVIQQALNINFSSVYLFPIGMYENLVYGDWNNFIGAGVLFIVYMIGLILLERFVIPKRDATY